jgi:hypothetical protein
MEFVKNHDIFVEFMDTKVDLFGAMPPLSQQQPLPLICRNLFEIVTSWLPTHHKGPLARQLWRLSVFVRLKAAWESLEKGYLLNLACLCETPLPLSDHTV